MIYFQIDQIVYIWALIRNFRGILDLDNFDGNIIKIDKPRSLKSCRRRNKCVALNRIERSKSGGAEIRSSRNKMETMRISRKFIVARGCCELIEVTGRRITVSCFLARELQFRDSDDGLRELGSREWAGYLF